MLDVQIILNPYISDAWFEQCLESVLAAEQNSPFPISISMHDPVPGHVGQARKRAFGEAVQPYVTWVDPDDWITPDAFEILAPGIAEGLPAIATTGKLIMPDGSLRKTRSGLYACRRELANSIEWEKFNTGCRPQKHCGTCELQRLYPARLFEGYCYYRRYGYGSWASKNVGE